MSNFTFLSVNNKFILFTLTMNYKLQLDITNTKKIDYLVDDFLLFQSLDKTIIYLKLAI